jgi:hypothetical protein
MNFTITSKLNKSDYIKVMFIGLYRKPAFIFCTVFGIYLLTSVLLNYLNVIKFYQDTPWFEIFGGTFLVLAPSLIVLLSVKQFKANPSFQNDMVFTFSDEGMVVQGDTFKSEFSWQHIQKHRELGKFLILYHTNKFGNYIDKSKLSADQLIFIKAKTRKKQPFS